MSDGRNQDAVSNEGVKPRALLKDVAAAAHCDVSLVSRKRARGKSDAQIIREGVARWKRQQRDEAATTARQIEAEAMGAPAEMPPDAESLTAKAAADLSSLTYDEAQRLKEIELYRRQKLANDEAEGKLIDAGAVLDGVGSLIANAKTRLRGIGSKLGPDLAMETSPAVCQSLVDEQVDEALGELAAWKLA